MPENRTFSDSPLLPKDFFDYYNPKEARSMLWKWLTATVAGNFDELTTIEKENILTFYERTSRLIDGVHSLEPKPEVTP